MRAIGRTTAVLLQVPLGLGRHPLDACRARDADGDGAVSISDLVTAVDRALWMLTAATQPR
jgi:hypothetical protein